MDNTETEMKETWNLFCKTLNTEYWDSAQKTWSELAENGRSLPMLKINTKDFFAKGFKFANTAKNDYASSELERLEADQTNLNNNLDNKNLLKDFLATAESVKKNL